MTEAPVEADEAAPLDSAAGEVPPPPTSASNWLFEAPSLGVSAPTAAFGLDAAGVMQVPADAVTVAWYRFTAVPGAPGNAVLAAHVDWGGQLGVFNRIDELTKGDHVRLVPGSGDPIVYVVQSTELVNPSTADVDAIIGTREGASTLTLITCGGPFNTISREYEQRVIVRAALASTEA